MIVINRWTVLFWGLCISLMLLMLIPEEQVVFRSLSVTLIAILCICHYLYKRYSKGLTLQADLLISISTLMQFLIPVFFLAPYYNAHPDMDIWVHRYGLALTSFAALLGQAMFFLGYESIRKGLYFPPVKETIRHIKINDVLIAMLPLAALVWFSRFILLSKGYYYQIHTSDFQFSSPYYSGLSQLSSYGLIIVGTFFVVAFSEKDKKKRGRKMKIAILLFLLEIGWYLPSGSRGRLVLTILCPIVAYLFVIRKLPIKTVILILIVGIPILSVLGEYRYVAGDYFGVSEINIQQMPDAYSAALERAGKDEAEFIVYRMIYRFYDGMNLNHLLIHFSNDYDYELGATYKNILYVFIPRFIYTDKPVFTQALGGWYQLVGSGSTPATFWGESYINFSWFGIIICSYLLGIFVKCYDVLFIRNAHKPYWCFIYVFSAITILQLPMEVFVIWVSNFTKFVLIAFLLTYLHSALAKTVRFSPRYSTITKQL